MGFILSRGFVPPPFRLTKAEFVRLAGMKQMSDLTHRQERFVEKCGAPFGLSIENARMIFSQEHDGRTCRDDPNKTQIYLRAKRVRDEWTRPQKS